MKKVLFILTILVLAFSVVALTDDYTHKAVIKQTEIVYNSIGSSYAFSSCLQNVCTNPETNFTSGVGYILDDGSGFPSAVVYGSAVGSSQQSLCVIARSEWGENAEIDAVAECCLIRQSSGITLNGGEPCLV